MPPKPTCKVVKREGQRGARIDPKGCKVRTTKDAQGNKKKENKQGQQKTKRTTTSKQRMESTLHRNMYGVHCAADCTASTAGGLISFDIDASLIYMPAC